MTIEKAVGEVVTALNHEAYRRATIVLNPELTVKATRRHRQSLPNKFETFILTIGTPNFRERAFIRVCEKAGEPFPIKKMILQPWPKSKRK